MNAVLAIASMIICFILGTCVHFEVVHKTVYQPAFKGMVPQSRIKYVLHQAMMPRGVKNADAWNGALLEAERQLCGDGGQDD